MTFLERYRPHPVQLTQVDCLSFSFVRLDVSADGLYAFPEIDIDVEQSFVYGENQGLLVLTVRSKKVVGEVENAHEAGGAQDGLNQPNLQFDLRVMANFTCEEGFPQEIMEVFMDADTPVLIVWPYVRALVAEMMAKTGLPPYHLPLLQIRTTLPVPDAAAGEDQ